MGELVFVGLGLNDEMGLSLRGLEELKDADKVFIELYTNVMPDFSSARLEAMCGKSLVAVARKDIEEDDGRRILSSAQTGKAVLVVPGDPLIATTHIALRVKAHKMGIQTRIVHGASVVSAVIGLSGLHNYKFGKSVTIPFPDETPSETPYSIIRQNRRLGLHTLCLLDIKADEKRFLSIGEGLNSLLKVETARKGDVITKDIVAVGVARAGGSSPKVKAGFVKDLLEFDFGGPPQSLVIVGSLHFMEAEALITLAGAPEQLRRLTK